MPGKPATRTAACRTVDLVRIRGRRSQAGWEAARGRHLFRCRGPVHNAGPGPASPSARTARREGPRVSSPVEEAAMRRALDLAARGLGETSPNPSVGAVILDPAGQTVGAGRTAPVAGPHAEVVALAQAGGRARGRTAVGTLENLHPHRPTRPPYSGRV